MTSVGYFPPISAELVAAKLEKIANFGQPELMEEVLEEPRLPEVLWFLQFVSQPENYPGGLARFCHDFINESAAAIGTAAMGNCRNRAFTFDELKTVYAELSSDAQYSLHNAVDEADCDLLNRLARVDDWNNASLWDIGFILDDEAPPARKPRPSIAKREQARLVTICTADIVRDACTKIAWENLAYYFKRLCEEPKVSFRRRDSKDWTHKADCAPWYFADVADALIAFIDRRKITLASRIAETEITKLVFEWMSVAHDTGRGVLIEGNSRFGKTEAIQLWCDMNPGIARLVNTPATNSVGDLMREVARA